MNAQDNDRDSDREAPGEQVAVIGMGGRFAGARSVGEFWRNLRDGVESVTRLSDEDVDRYLGQLDPLSARHAKQQAHKPGYVKAGFFIEDPESFDAAFFGFNPSEIELVDPQHRIFLEISWEAFEDAGYDPFGHDGRVGVYAGTLLSRYMLFNVFANREIMYSERDFVAGVGNEVDYLPTRVSYKLDLRGPSVSVQTACSTSLVAVHLACQGLLDGECDMALAGGSVLQVPTRQGYLYQEGSMVSSDGRCRAFDAGAEGTVFAGGGAGCVLLKRLSDALADGDHIYAVVRGSAINNDGSRKVGFTAPSVDGQVAAITEALDVADIDPRSVSYIEAHGTGTPLGDPVEIEALTKAYRGFTDDRQFCAIGSVKPNIGHTAAAAGVASFMKVSLALQHGQIPPSLNYSVPNPRIDFEASPFYVNTELQAWQAESGVRRAGVSSFGVGGTNAHAILEQAPTVAPSDDGRPWQLLSLSARSEPALSDSRERLAAFLEADPSVSLPDLAYTLHVGRGAKEHRFGCAVRDRTEAIRALRGGSAKLGVVAEPLADRCRAVFMFSGQGSQYVDMARELYEHEPIFKADLERCSDLLQGHTGWCLTELLYPRTEDREAASTRLGSTEVTQPALFAVEYSLARLLMAWGVRPEAMIGHSVGEWVCACIAGVISLEDALRVVAVRGELMGRQRRGAMISVRLPEQELLAMLPEGCSLAAVNGPEFCVVAGEQEAIDALAAGDLPTQVLHTSHAFHSAMMDPVLEPFETLLRKIDLHPPRIPYVSNVSGTWVRAEQACDPSYWCDHLRHTVRFRDGIEALTERSGAVLIEVGPGTALTGLAKQCLRATSVALAVNCLAHPRDETPAMGSLFAALARMWAAGVMPSWPQFYAEQRRLRVSAPTYPFQRRRFWIEPNREAMGGADAPSDEKLPLERWCYAPTWARKVAPPCGAVTNETVLFLHRGSVLDRGLVEAMRATGRLVVDVLCADERPFELDGDAGSAAPAEPTHYAALLERLVARGDSPDRVLHSLSVRDEGVPNALERLDELRDRGFSSLVALAQAIGTHLPARDIAIDVLSSGLADVGGGETLVPEQATLLGPCRVIPLEYPRLRCRVVDLNIAEVAAESIAPGLVLAELDAEWYPFVAYRRGRRWVQSYEAVTLAEAPKSVPALLREGGIYLVTGGLGGLGLVHAEQLAAHAPVKLALLARRALPGRELWDGILADEAGEPETKERITKIRAIEALGSEVMTLGADVADEKQMRAAVQQVRERFGGLDGIVHCAGIAGGGLIQLKRPEAVEQVFDAKIRGTLVLERVTADQPLDFVLLSSSLFAVCGGVGQVDYCGANNALDSLARAGRFAHAKHVISIGWDAWDEVGMARAMIERLKASDRDASEPTWQALELPLLDGRARENAGRVRYLARLDPDKRWALREHRIGGKPTVPGTLHLEMARAAFAHDHPEGIVQLRDVFFMRPMQLEPGQSRDARLTLDGDSGNARDFVIEGRTASGWTTHASGRVVALATQLPQTRDLAALRERCKRVVTPVSEPTGSASEGAPFVEFGAHWHTVSEVLAGNGEALVRLELPEALRDDLSDFCLHPALLDMATGPTSEHAVPERVGQGEEPFLPLSYGSLTVFAPLGGTLISHMRYAPRPSDGPDTVTLEVEILDEHGALLVQIKEFALQRVRTSDGESRVQPPSEVQESASEAIAPREGAEVLGRLLAAPIASHVVVSTRSLEYVLRRDEREDEAEEVARQAPRAAHARPDIGTPYVEPQTPLEHHLATIWQGVLGIDRVGRHDNFFDLGADSVLGVQVVSKAREIGITLNPAQLFDHQSVAELAEVAVWEGQSAIEGDVSELPSAPAMRTSVGDYMAFALTLPERRDLTSLVAACSALIGEEECLQVRFEAGGPRLDRASPPPPARLEIAEPADESEVRARLAKLLSSGNSLIGVGIVSGAGTTATVLLDARVCDRVTASALRERLSEHLTGGEPFVAVAESAFARWLGAADRFAHGEDAERIRERSQASLDATPTGAWPPLSEADARFETYAVEVLDNVPAESLWQLAESVYQLKPAEVVLAALAHALAERSGETLLLFDVVIDARDLEVPQGDWVRVHGNLEFCYPLALEFGVENAAIDRLVRIVKERRRESRRHALATGWTLESAANRAVRFDGEGLRAPPVVSADPEPIELWHSPLAERPPHSLTLSCRTVSGALQLEWRYDRARVTQVDVENLSRAMRTQMERLAEQLRTSDRVVFTPSDFPDAGLDQDALSELMASLTKDTVDANE